MLPALPPSVSEPEDSAEEEGGRAVGEEEEGPGSTDAGNDKDTVTGEV